MARRADTSLSLLILRSTHVWLDNLIRRMRIGYCNVHHHVQWVDKGKEAEEVSKPDVLVRKVMLYVWWSVHGEEYCKLMGEGVTVTAEVYINQLQKLKAYF